MKLIVTNNDVEKTYDLKEEGVTIGRLSNNVIPLDDNGCSRNHCVIEFRNQQYYVTDLGSFNGTKLNGQKVTSEAIKHGDQIQIGSTTISVVDPDQPLEAISVKPVISKKASSRARRNKQATPVATIVAIIVLLTVVWIGHKFYRSYQYYTFYTEKYQEAIALANSGNHRAAVTIFEEIVESVPETELSVQAAKNIQELEQLLAYRRKAQAEFKTLLKRYEDREIPPKEFISATKLLQETYPNNGNESEWQKKLDVAKTEYDYQMGQLFQATVQSANTSLQKEEYLAAILYYQSFVKNYQDANWQKKAAQEIDKIEEIIELNWRKLQQEIGNLQQRRMIREAYELAQREQKRFKGTYFAPYLEKWLAEVSKSPLLQEKPVEPDYGKTDIHRFLARDDNKKLIQKSKWQELANLLASSKEKWNYKPYLEDIKRIIALEKKFLQETDPEKTEITLELAGKPARVAKIVDGSFLIKIPKETGSIEIKWVDLPLKNRLDLLRKIAFNTEYHLGLATFCMTHALKDEAMAILVYAIENAPNSKKTIDAFFSRWTGIPIPETTGFIVYEKYLITPEEKAIYEYQTQVQKFCTLHEHGAKKSLENDLEKLYTTIVQAQNPHVRMEQNNLLFRELIQLRRNWLEKIRENFDLSAVKYIRALKAELEKRRQFALELIFNEQVYPADETHGSAAQPEVDKRVASVREIWQTPSKGIEKISPQVDLWKQNIRSLEKFLQKNYKAESVMLDSEELVSLDTFVDGLLNIQNFAETADERRRIEDNKRLLQENINKESKASAPEREQVRITNEYRHLMGMRCLEIDDALTVAARNHSSYLLSTGLFAHVVPDGPDGASPMDRTKKAGFRGNAVGENIYKGSASAAAAHDGWIHSAGHHRNILNKSWRYLGSGVQGNHWTQNFGS